MSASFVLIEWENTFTLWKEILTSVLPEHHTSNKILAFALWSLLKSAWLNYHVNEDGSLGSFSVVMLVLTLKLWVTVITA